jgi:uncharacterized protein (TIGR02598 family)
MKRISTRRAFSLVEVTLALGIAVFCILPIIALLPIGIQWTQATARETAAANLATAVSSDLQATPAGTSTSPYFGFTLSGPSTNNYLISEAGQKVTAISSSQPTYLVTVVFSPPSKTINAATARILITWPAISGQANQAAIPSNYAGSYDTVIGLSRN